MPTANTDDDGGRSMGRRGFMRGIGATAAAGVALSGAGGDWSPVGNAEAINPAIFGAASGGLALDWALRTFDVLGQSTPADGLSASALKQDVYETVRTRKSTNASTFVDNRNIIASGLESSLYADGKLAAIEALNNQETQSAVETAAHDAMKKHAATIEKNLLKTWNESLAELDSLLQTVNNHPDVTEDEAFGRGTLNGNSWPDIPFSSVEVGIEVGSVTLTDGTTFDVSRVGKGMGTDDPRWDPTSYEGGSHEDHWVGAHHPADGDDAAYLQYTVWSGIWSDLQTAITNVESGLTTWVNNIYSSVQSGDIQISELITPRERAKMLEEDGAAAAAIADLHALGVAVDAEHEVTIEMVEEGATLTGTLGLSSDQEIQAGTSYTPSASTFDGLAYFTYDVSMGEGTWSAYSEGVDGGTATFTSEPFEKTLYKIDTTDGETAEVKKGDFTPVDSSGNSVDPTQTEPAKWQTDLSDQLSNAITNIEQVRYFSTTSESQMETIQLQDEFKVVSITNTDSGKEKQSLKYDSPEAQTDNNYVTQEEWNQLQQQNKELIEQFEESQANNNDGGNLIGGIGLPGGLEGAATTAVVGGVVVAGGALAVLKKAADFYFPGR